MILKDLINSCDVEAVASRIVELYPDQEAFKDRYVNILLDLKNREVPEKLVKDRKLTVYVTHVWDGICVGDTNPEEYEAVSGYSYEEGISYACEFCSFDEWLAMDVAEKSLRHYGQNDFLAHVLWEMTFVSFEENDIELEKEKLVTMVDRFKKGVESEKDIQFHEMELDPDVDITDKDQALIEECMKKSQEFMNEMLGLEPETVNS